MPTLVANAYPVIFSSKKRCLDDMMFYNDGDESECCTRPRRVVRFKLDTAQNEETASTSPRAPTHSKQRRQAMLKRRRIAKSQNLKKGILSYDNWLSSLEIKKLHLECAREITNLEQLGTAAATTPILNENHIEADAAAEDVLSLSRFLTSRRKQKLFVQKQLYDTVRAVQDFQSKTGIRTPELIASECSKFSKKMHDVAHLEGLCLHVQVAASSAVAETDQDA
ncbi:MAG: hypothetical protein SGILL_007873 [Bacillariaceae sp.]